MAINNVDNATPVPSVDSSSTVNRWSWLKNLSSKVFRRNTGANSEQNLNPEIKNPPNLLSIKVESLIKAGEISEEETQGLRKNKASLVYLSGPKTMSEILIAGASVAETRIVIESYLKQGRLNPQLYSEFLLPDSQIDQSQHFWDVDYVDREQSPRTETDRWFVKLFALTEKHSEDYLQTRTQRREISSRLGEKVNRHEIVKVICSDLLERYGVSEESREQVLSEVVKGVSFQREPDYVPDVKKGKVRIKQSLASHVRESRELKFSVDSFLDPKEISRDISTAEHELIHYFKTIGLIHEDVVVPVASAQTVLALYNSGEELISKDDASIPSFKISKSRWDNIQKNLSQAKSPWEFYVCSLLPNGDDLLLKSDSLATFNQGLRQKFGENEERHTYLLGTFLGAALIARERIIGTGYAQSYLAALAHGYNLSEAEIMAQIAASREMSFGTVLASFGKHQHQEIKDGTPYTKLSAAKSAVEAQLRV